MAALVLFLVQHGRHEDARAVATAFRETAAANQNTITLARCLAAISETEQADQLLRAVLDADRDSAVNSRAVVGYLRRHPTDHGSHESIAESDCSQAVTQRTTLGTTAAGNDPVLGWWDY